MQPLEEAFYLNSVDSPAVGDAVVESISHAEVDLVPDSAELLGAPWHVRKRRTCAAVWHAFRINQS